MSISKWKKEQDLKKQYRNALVILFATFLIFLALTLIRIVIVKTIDDWIVLMCMVAWAYFLGSFAAILSVKKYILKKEK